MVLGVRLMMHHENDESIWIFTECIVKWRVDNKSKYSHLCLITIDQLSVADNRGDRSAKAVEGGDKC